MVNALRRLGIEPTLTDDAELLKKADKVLFPGQGHAGEAMDYLRAHKLDEVIRDLKQPVFGICVGQQLLCKHSEEGDTECIGDWARTLTSTSCTHIMYLFALRPSQRQTTYYPTRPRCIKIIFTPASSTQKRVVRWANVY